MSVDRLDYERITATTGGRRARAWAVAGVVATAADLAFALYVGRNVHTDGQYGGIYGFGGHAAKMVLLAYAVNAAAIIPVVKALVIGRGRARWWLCACFLVHAYVALIYLNVVAAAVRSPGRFLTDSTARSGVRPPHNPSMQRTATA